MPPLDVVSIGGDAAPAPAEPVNVAPATPPAPEPLNQPAPPDMAPVAAPDPVAVAQANLEEVDKALEACRAEVADLIGKIRGVEVNLETLRGQQADAEAREAALEKQQADAEAALDAARSVAEAAKAAGAIPEPVLPEPPANPIEPASVAAGAVPAEAAALPIGESIAFGTPDPEKIEIWTRGETTTSFRVVRFHPFVR